MPGPVGKPADEKLKDTKKSKRGRREDGQLAELAKIQLTAEAPVKPKDLDEAASAHWDYLVEMLIPLRLMSPLDGPMLEMMCVAYAHWKEAEKKVGKNLVTKVSGGGERVSGWTKVAKEQRAIYDSCADRFGMTPAARARMKIPLPKVRDDGKVTDSKRARYYGAGV